MYMINLCHISVPDTIDEISRDFIWDVSVIIFYICILYIIISRIYDIWKIFKQ